MNELYINPVCRIQSSAQEGSRRIWYYFCIIRSLVPAHAALHSVVASHSTAGSSEIVFDAKSGRISQVPYVNISVQWCANERGVLLTQTIELAYQMYYK